MTTTQHAASRTTLLAIGFCCDVPAERIEILRKTLAAARMAGNVRPVLLVTGNPDAVQAVADGVPVLSLGPAFGLQQGESAIGCAAIDHADVIGADWIVKIAGDTYHPSPGWADALVDLGERMNASLVATDHHIPGRVNTQVFAARREFLRYTWPRPQDPRLTTQGIEPTWGETIRRAGLEKQWHSPDAIRITDGGCVNFAPKDEAITYYHAHTLAKAAAWTPLRSVAASPADVSLSIVIPARNEIFPDKAGRPLLARTFHSLVESSEGYRLPETILVDDGSDKPLPLTSDSCPLASQLPLRVLRNASPLGVDPSRNIGAAAASGDCIGILDGHMACQSPQGELMHGAVQRLAATAMERNAIVVARCGHLELEGEIAHPGNCSSNFVPITNDKHLCGNAWDTTANATGLRRTTCMLGASYFMPRTIWERLGGFVDCCENWGFSEEGLAMKAAFLGIPIYCLADVTISHWFRSKGPHPFQVVSFHKWINCGKVLKVAFSPEVFDSFWLPRVKMIPVFVNNWLPQNDAALNDVALIRERARFQAKKIREDADVMLELFGVTL